jgi:tRNA (guanine37-N1)-methyltransferase
MKFDIVTIFPKFFAGPFDHGVLRRAIANGTVEVRTHDLREFTHDRHRTVDDRPFGGGEGMVLKPEPIWDCLAALGVSGKAERDMAKETVVLLSAQGRPFTQAVAAELAGLERVVFLCGRYEGVDERVNELLCDREISIGDYVLSGGELPAAVIVDAVVRLLPGVLGNPDSSRFESFGSKDEGSAHEAGAVPPSTYGAGGLLDYPHYTRPAEFRGLEVPAVLQGGDHLAIRRWRRERALEKTWRNRPDLLREASLTDVDHDFIDRLERQRIEEPLPDHLKSWEEVLAYYLRYKLAPGSINMLQLCTRIQDSDLAPGLFVWTSHLDLCIQQTRSYPYTAPYLRVSPLRGDRMDFRYLDTPIESKQWHRIVPADQAFERLVKFTEQLHWFARGGAI